jgi:hypothetical protein
MPEASTANGLDLQTIHNTPIGANNVSCAVTNRAVAECPLQGRDLGATLFDVSPELRSD